MVSANDLKCFKTTNNLGGAITATQITSATPNNLFSNVPKNELVVGEDYYACVFWKNGHTTESMDNFKIWLSDKSFPHDTEIKWGFEPSLTGTNYKWSPYFTGNGTSTVDSTADTGTLRLTVFTLSAWFKTTTATEMTIAGKGGFGTDTAGQNDNYSIRMMSDTRIRAGFEEGNGTDHYCDSATGYNDGLWHFVLITYDGTLVALYIDDMVNPVDTNTTSATPETVNTNPFNIGKNPRAADRYWNGLIDEVRVWNRGMTDAEERQALMDNNVASATGLVLEKKFGADSTTAQTIADKYTAPIGVTWNELGGEPSTINVGKLTAGSSFPMWIWYHVNANAVERLDDSELFAAKFNIPQGGTGAGGGTGTYHYEPYGTYTGASITTQADAAALDLTDFSIACWFRTTKDYTTDGAGYLVVKGDYLTETAGQNINYALLISTDVDPNNVLEVLFETSTGANRYNVSGVKVNTGEWVFGVGTWDSTNSKVYVNGVLKNTVNFSGSTPDTNNLNLAIGGHIGFQTYVGDLDEVRIWNTALTDSEISNLYLNGIVPKTGNIVYENLFGGSSGTGGGGGTGGNPPPLNSNYKIAVAGDWGCESETDDVISMIKSQNYDHVLGVGDNAYASASCWTTRFNTLKSKMNSGYGNHEYEESGGITPYKTFFGHNKTYFTYKFQNIQFFVFDSNINFASGSTQYNEMTAAITASLNDNTVSFRVAVFHHPWFGASSQHTYNDNNMVQTFHKFFTDNKINLVLTGHNHNWQRTKQVAYNSGSPTNPTVVGSSSPFSAATKGIIHVVSGGGGHDSGSGLYSLGSQPSFQAYQSRVNNGVWEMVASNNGQTLTCSFVDTNGEKYDTFIINA